MRHLPLLLALCISIPTTTALAQSRQRDLRPVPPTIIAKPLAIAIAAFDSNGDMVVSLAEYEAGVSRSFAFGDRDGDGAMGLIEFTAWSEAVLGNPGTVPGPFDFDRSGDDRISRMEFEAYFAARRDEMDVNKDGSLSRSELVTAMWFHPPRRANRGDRGYWSEEQEPQRKLH